MPAVILGLREKDRPRQAARSRREEQVSQEMEDQKNVLEGQIEALNEDIKELGYKLEGILDVGCSLGVCAFDPEVDDVQEKIKEVQKKRAILERLRDNLDSCVTD
jgi:predicted RNase H-like nuclease (RuvC/YqgF family)